MRATARIETRGMSQFVSVITWSNGAKWKSQKEDTVSMARLAANILARDLGLRLEWE